MAKTVKRRFARTRRVFRWCRIVIWLVILVVVVAGIYLNTIGLPDFLKRPLLSKLQAQGVQVDFSRMRLQWYRGIVVDQATFTFLKHPLQPKMSSEETELNLNLRSLRDSRLKLNSIAIKQGNLIWPVSKTNELELTLSNINTRIQFHPNEEIVLDPFEGNFENTKIRVTGSVTNVSAFRDWKFFQRKKPGVAPANLEKFAAVLEQIHLAGSPEIKLEFTGDAAAPESFKGKFSFTAASAKTPWGNETNLQLTAELRDFSSAGNNFVRVKAETAETPWGRASKLNGVVKFLIAPPNGALQADLKFSAKRVQLQSGRADSVKFTASAPLSFTNFIPTNISGKASLANAETKWGKAASADITFSIATNSAPKKADEGWAAWRYAEPFHVNWEGNFAKVESPKLQMKYFSCAGTWRAPDLQITNLNVELYGGKVAAVAQLNVATREGGAKGSSDFDVQKISPLLTPFGQRWIGKYTWESPPKLTGAVRVVLPSWTNRAPSWRTEVLPTLELNGQVSVERGTYRDVSATSAKTDFTYSNMVWTLPHLRVNRPEGGADLNLVANDRTREYRWRINSQIDPNAVRHLLAEQQQHVFDDFQFTAPPEIRVELRGKWNELEKLSAVGEIAAQKFSYRSNAVDKLTCSIQFTNQNLQVTEGRLDQGDKFITAKKIELDLPTKKIFFTEIYGTVDPYPVTRLIGKKVAANIAPYQFSEPPAIRLNGNLTIGKVEEADMHFLVDGTQFKWREFDIDRISGRLDWVGETLLLTNMQAQAYRGGTIAGWSYFDFAPTNGTSFHFDFAGADIDFPSLISGLSGKTNQLEGRLHGQWILDSGNTRDLKTWLGHGRANLREGLIWEVPIFGIFSPLLNALLPGAGNSRAREASGTFVVKDGIVYSDDLEIRALGFRMQYRGGVDFQQNVNARVEAELLRDTWIIGPLISLVLTPISKVFEYKVGGTLGKPETEPVYIPNFLMMTLRPFNTLKEAFTPNKSEATPTTEPPAEKKP